MSARLPGRPAHLARRFFGSLSGAEPDSADEAAVRKRLRPVEANLLDSLCPADRRHAVRCGRKAERLLGDRTTDTLVAAAALHDVGKLRAELGTVQRVLATLAGGLLGRDRLRRIGARRPPMAAWARFCDHAELGALMLADLDCAPEVVAWAREHHQPPKASSLGTEIAALLAQADD